MAFTDSRAYQVKVYDPVDKVVTVLAGSGQRGNEDGTAKSCTFVQPHGICTVGETIFVTDAATGNVKLITELSGTTQFLKHLGLLYDSFGITCKGTIVQHITPQQMVQKVNEINTYLKATVSKVKEDNNLKETATTNGPQGTVSQKTQQSVQLLLKGVKRLLENINTINPEFAKHIDWSTLLTTTVENLHAVSHFKHETFSVLQYAMDFGTISKESLKRITKWKASYFTHPASHYPVPQASMPLSAAKFMTALPAESIPKEAEMTMKEWAELYRPVRQRTVRSETTKDKAGALPPAVYEKPKTGTWSELSFPDSCAKSSTASVSHESVPLSTSFACPVVTFVSDEEIPQVLIGTEPEPFQMDEFESDSDSDFDETKSEEIVEHRNAITRSGRHIKASVRFDL